MKLAKKFERIVKDTVEPILEKGFKDYQKKVFINLSGFIIKLQAEGYSDKYVLLAVKVYIKAMVTN